MDFDLLPVDCIALILSLTSPRDTCRVSVASSSVRSMADSDSVWQEFLPSDYREIMSRIVSDRIFIFSSKKDLFLKLCNPCLIDGGKKIFSIEKSTNKKCYMLSARELSITWATHPLYWSWKPHPESRFSEVAELITIWWLEICCIMNTKMLSPRTIYAAYFIVKFADRAYGLGFLPTEVSIEVGNFKSQGNVCLLNPSEGRKKNPLLFGRSNNARFSPNNNNGRTRLVEEEEERGAICERKDGWFEIELGRFFNDGIRDEEVKISLKEVKGQHLKGGLIIEGIELRPKHLSS